LYWAVLGSTNCIRLSYHFLLGCTHATRFFFIIYWMVHIVLVYHNSHYVLDCTNCTCLSYHYLLDISNSTRVSHHYFLSYTGCTLLYPCIIFTDMSRLYPRIIFTDMSRLYPYVIITGTCRLYPYFIYTDLYKESSRTSYLPYRYA